MPAPSRLLLVAVLALSLPAAAQLPPGTAKAVLASIDRCRAAAPRAVGGRDPAIVRSGDDAWLVWPTAAGDGSLACVDDMLVAAPKIDSIEADADELVVWASSGSVLQLYRVSRRLLAAAKKDGRRDVAAQDVSWLVETWRDRKAGGLVRLDLRPDPDMSATMKETVKRLEAIDARDCPAFGDAQEANRKLLVAFAQGGGTEPRAPLTIVADQGRIRAGEPAAVWPGARRRLVWAAAKGGPPRLKLD